MVICFHILGLRKRKAILSVSIHVFTDWKLKQQLSSQYDSSIFDVLNLLPGLVFHDTGSHITCATIANNNYFVSNKNSLYCYSEALN